MKKHLQLITIILFAITGWSNNVKAILPTGSPVANFSASATSVCVGGSITFTDASSNSPTSWTWTFIGGNPLTSTSQNPTVTYSTAGTYAVTLTASNANGSGTLTQSGYIIVTSAAPATPSIISGTSIICPSTTTNTYSVTAVAGATYNWTVSSGATIVSGQGTHSVSINFISWTSGSISVTASNACGTSATRTLVLNSTLPAPGIITGATVQCGGNTGTYSIAAVSGVSSYNWTAPTGATIISGQGTTSVIVSFGVGFTSGTLSVSSVNSCGNGAPRNLTITNTPAALGVITGSTTACGGSVQTYSVPVSAGATSYNWTLPTGATGTSNSNTITVIFPAAFVSGNITVSASSGCASTAVRTLFVRSIIATAGVITGPIYGCPNSTNVYSSPVIAGATSYTWTITGNATIISGQGTNSVMVNFGSTYTTGVLSVVANNTCGSSPASTRTINNFVAHPGSIHGPTTGLCAAGISTTLYYVATVPGAVAYTWTLPSGATGSSTTDSILVTFGATFTSGNITVASISPCGVVSSAIVLALRSIVSTPGAITGQTTGLCSGTFTYSIVSVPGATNYTWTTSIAGATIASSGTTATITFPAFTTGTISVTADNACGSSAVRTITVTSTPAEPGLITGDSWTCGLTDTIYSIAPVPNATSYNWTVPNHITITSGQGTTSISVLIDTSFYSGNITVAAQGASGCSSVARSKTVGSTITPGPISGPSNVANMTSASYSIAPVPHAASYQWTETHSPASALIQIVSGQGSNQITVNFPTNSTNFTGTGVITVKAIFDCSISRDASTTPSQPISKPITGIRKGGTQMNQTTNYSNSFSPIYPNPSHNEFIIDITSETDKDILVEVYDALGNRTISNVQHIASGQSSLKTSTETLSKGIYFVRLLDSDNNLLYNQTVVKE